MVKSHKTDLKSCKTKWVDASVDHGAVGQGAAVRIVLRNLGANLEALIDAQKSGYLLIACAWFTSLPLLRALQRAKRRGVQVVVLVQKEAWLKAPRSKWNKQLIKEYAALGTHDQLPMLEASCLINVQAVRCVGKLVGKQDAARMHNKFVVFGDQSGAQSVWTGSYNFSAAAEDSFENAVLISDSTCASSFLREFQTLMLLSEPLDSPWRVMRPSWR